MSVTKKLGLNKLTGAVKKYGLQMEFVLIRTDEGYCLDYNVVSRDKIINHITLPITKEEFEDFVSGKTNQIVKRC